MVKSAKKPVDENAPKRPQSAYFLWMGQNRPTFVKKNPSASIGELGKMMGAAWGKISDSDKVKFTKAADKNKEVYAKKMEKYKVSAAYKKHQEALKDWKKNQAKKPFGKDPNRPKRALSAYLLFVNAERPGLMKSGLSVTEVASAASKKWNKMSDSDKASWQAKADKAKAKQQKEIEKYEKSAKHKQYMAEKAKYEAEQKAKRKADRSGSSMPPAKKPKSVKSKSRSKSKGKKKSA